jgi:hypothetical protein
MITNSPLRSACAASTSDLAASAVPRCTGICLHERRIGPITGMVKTLALARYCGQRPDR